MAPWEHTHQTHLLSVGFAQAFDAMGASRNFSKSSLLDNKDLLSDIIKSHMVHVSTEDELVDGNVYATKWVS